MDSNSSSSKNKYLSMIIKITLILVLLSAIICGCYLSYHKGYTKGLSERNSCNSSTIDKPLLSTNVGVKWKDKETDSDLILNNHYKATIDGHEVEIPVKPKKIKNSLESKQSPSNVTATVDQTLDLTPLYKDYEKKKNWEMGIGVGSVSGGEWYIPVQVQRNFSKDKAIEVQLNVSPDKKSVSGAQVTYKIRF